MFYKIKSYLCMRKKDFMNTKSPFIMITKHQNSYLMEQMVSNLKLA